MPDEDLHSPLLPELGFDAETLITPPVGLWDKIFAAVLDPTTPLLDTSTVPGADTHDDPNTVTTATADASDDVVASSAHRPLLHDSDTSNHHVGDFHHTDDHGIGHHLDHHDSDGHGW